MKMLRFVLAGMLLVNTSTAFAGKNDLLDENQKIFLLAELNYSESDFTDEDALDTILYFTEEYDTVDHNGNKLENFTTAYKDIKGYSLKVPGFTPPSNDNDDSTPRKHILLAKAHFSLKAMDLSNLYDAFFRAAQSAETEHEGNKAIEAAAEKFKRILAVIHRLTPMYQTHYDVMNNIDAHSHFYIQMCQAAREMISAYKDFKREMNEILSETDTSTTTNSNDNS